MTQHLSKDRAKRGMLPMTLALLIGLAASAGAHAGGVYSDQASYISAAGTSSTPITFADVTVPNSDMYNTFNNAATIAVSRYVGWNLPNATVVGTNYAFGVAAAALINDTAGPLTLNLSTADVSAVGFNLAIFGGGTGTVSVFDGAIKLASISLTIADETQLNTFFGYVGTSPITSITIAPDAFAAGDAPPLALATNLQYSISAVPEPASASLAVCGLAFLLGFRRRS